MNNPYSQKSFAVSGRGDEVVAGSKQFHMPGSAEPIVASNGEFNANTTKEAVQALAHFLDMVRSGEVKKSEDVVTAAQKKQILSEAVTAGVGSEAYMAVGETLVSQVNETLGREGFARRFMQYRQMNNGDVFKVRLRKRDTLAFVTTSNPNTIASVARQQFAFPDMFNLTANVKIEKIEIAQDTGDLLQDRYEDALENIMCAEDRVFLKMAKEASGIFNPSFGFTDFTPTVCSKMQTAIQSNGGIPVTQMLISYDIWNDIKANPEFTAWFSEIAKHELVLEGQLGTIMGMNIITDGYRIPTLQVLPQNTVYMFGAPETLGVIGQWGDVSVASTDHAVNGTAAVGWFINSVEGMCLGNARAVVRGERL
jgi:hypothetical protein